MKVTGCTYATEVMKSSWSFQKMSDPRGCHRFLCALFNGTASEPQLSRLLPSFHYHYQRHRKRRGLGPSKAFPKAWRKYLMWKDGSFFYEDPFRLNYA